MPTALSRLSQTATLTTAMSSKQPLTSAVISQLVLTEQDWTLHNRILLEVVNKMEYTPKTTKRKLRDS